MRNLGKADVKLIVLTRLELRISIVDIASSVTRVSTLRM